MELKNTEKLEHSVVALTIEITKAEFEAAKDKAFKKSGKNITVPGFRKGKAPRKMIEKLYGEGVFFEEAFNILYPQAMDMAVEKSGPGSGAGRLQGHRGREGDRKGTSG